MNSKNAVFLMIALIIFGIFSFLSVMISNEKGAGSFNLEDYQSYVDSFPSERFVGPILDESIAIQQAEALWTEIYGETVLEQKPYTALFDSTNNVWLVMGHVPDGYIGGIPCAIIQSDGKVLAVWHSK